MSVPPLLRRWEGRYPRWVRDGGEWREWLVWLYFPVLLLLLKTLGLIRK